MGSPRILLAWAWAAGWAASGCGLLTESPTVTTVELTPAARALTALGDTIQFSAAARDQNGAPMPDQVFAWSSSAPAVAELGTSTGMAIAKANGSTTISATAGGVAGTAALTVSQAVASVTVTPVTRGLSALGDTARFLVALKDARGNPVSGVTAQWSSSDTTVARVDASGKVTAVRNGTSIIAAAGGGRADSATVTVAQAIVIVAVAPDSAVMSPGDTVRLTATPKDRNGFPVSGRVVAWNSAATVVADVSASGLVSAGGMQLGPVQISATVEGHTEMAKVRVVVSFGFIAAGQRYACGLTDAGVPYCWGYDAGGPFGNGGSIGPVTDPVLAATPGPGAFQSLTAAPGDMNGFSHACGITPQGAAYCWGHGGSGQLGDGTTTWIVNTPVAVAGGLSFAMVSAGTDHTCGLTTGGAAYCWGLNDDDQLGDSSTTSRTAPVPVAGGLSFVSIAAGSRHSCGVTTTGAGYCWGNNSNSQLGNGTTTSSLVPVPVSGGLTLASVTARGHTCALTTAGAAYCWGYNAHGQLGDGTTTSRSVPTPVAGGVTFTALSAGASHTCGVAAGAAAYCWGSGGLGASAPTQSSVPVQVAGGIAFASIAAGTTHTCGVSKTGQAYCWGDNEVGQLGDGTTTDRLTPTLVSGSRR